MKKFLIILILCISVQSTYANSCSLENKDEAKALNDKVYDVIMKRIETTESKVDQLIYLNAISRKISDIKSVFKSDLAQCALS